MYLVMHITDDTLETGDVTNCTFAMHTSLDTATQHANATADCHYPDDAHAETVRQPIETDDLTLPVYRVTRYPDNNTSHPHHVYEIFCLKHVPTYS